MTRHVSHPTLAGAKKLVLTPEEFAKLTASGALRFQPPASDPSDITMATTVTTSAAAGLTTTCKVSHPLTDMVSWAFVFLSSKFELIPCAQCVLSWSVGPLSLCLVLSNFYTMCTLCSLTNMVIWAFVSFVLRVPVLHHVHNMFSHWHGQLGLYLIVLWVPVLLHAHSVVFEPLTHSFHSHQLSQLAISLCLLIFNVTHPHSLDLSSHQHGIGFVFLPHDCHSVASCLWAPKHHHHPVNPCFILSN